MLSASWKAPMFTAASPKKQTRPGRRCRYLMANAMPVASGMWPPTMPCPPRKPSEASNRCIEPPLPLRAARRLAEQLGHHRSGGHAPRQRVAVLAVGGGDVVVGPERGDAADRHRFLPDVEVAEAADLAQAVGLARLFLEAADEQHLPQVAGRQLGVGLGLLRGSDAVRLELRRGLRAIAQWPCRPSLGLRRSDASRLASAASPAPRHGSTTASGGWLARAEPQSMPISRSSANSPGV